MRSYCEAGRRQPQLRCKSAIAHWFASVHPTQVWRVGIPARMPLTSAWCTPRRCGGLVVDRERKRIQYVHPTQVWRVGTIRAAHSLAWSAPHAGVEGWLQEHSQGSPRWDVALAGGFDSRRLHWHDRLWSEPAVTGVPSFGIGWRIGAPTTHIGTGGDGASLWGLRTLSEHPPVPNTTQTMRAR